MEDIYLKIKDVFSNGEIEDIDRYAYQNLRSKDLMTISDLICIVEELVGKCESLEEDLEHEIQDKRDNYKPLSPYEMYGISESDFH
jgi:hypothetical protein